MIAPIQNSATTPKEVLLAHVPRTTPVTATRQGQAAMLHLVVNNSHSIKSYNSATVMHYHSFLLHVLDMDAVSNILPLTIMFYKS
jgi:hypothetical protein